MRSRLSRAGAAFVLGAATVVFTAAPALAVGDITGTVTDGLSGDAVEGICVEAHDSVLEGTIAGSTTTASDGTYTLAGLADGSYKLFFYEPGTCGSQIETGTPEWSSEWHDDAADHLSATIVVIAGGNQTVDAVLLGTGTVEGTPNDGLGTDLNCVTARLFDTSDFSTTLVMETTSGDNMYSFTGLITGVTYTLRFQTSGVGDCSGLASEWHGDIPVRIGTEASFGDVADTFTVTAGELVTIDPTLEPPGTVSGTMISERTGLGIENATIRFYPVDAGGNASGTWIEIDTTTDGAFVIDETAEQLPPNNYKLFAISDSDPGLTWDGEWWNDQPGAGAATLIPVTSGADTALGDLDRHGPGAVSGTVTEEGSGDPIQGVVVNLYDEAGITILASDTTDATGLYDLGEMDPADYDVEFTHAMYDDEWNAGHADQGTGTTTVAASVEDDPVTTTLDQVLALSDGSISGTVTEDGTGDPVDGATVTLYEPGGIVVVDSTSTDVNGDYSLATVPAGDYDLEFAAIGYVTEWFDDQADAASGSVSVGGAEAVTADAMLAVADGSISGTVTDDGTGDPIAGATVTLSTSAGGFVADTTTAGDGTYSFDSVGAGEYDLEFVATGYVTEWYDDAAGAGPGSVVVGGGQAVVADAALAEEAPPPPDPGTISGTITDDSDLLAGPVSGVTVEAHQGGVVIGSDTSGADGTFSIAGLAPGTYTVLANTGPAADPDTYFSQWYGGAPLFVTEDASDVVVAAGGTASGTDIALQPLFVDVVAGSGFYADIVWMQESGITVGCGNDAYCPDDFVTRAQMATFLVKALDLPADATDYFSDDNGNIHEANINALRGAGITLGCDQAGTMFCPQETVSRAQMASFIVRGLGYPISGTDYFTDDDGNTHEDNINTLRENNVTLGCNPAGTLYCPDDSVRRDHMAAFLFRALG